MNIHTLFIKDADTRPPTHQSHWDGKDVTPGNWVSLLNQHEC